ncbi:MAG: phosphohistidine phosphatase SixA [Cyanobacteria bacterium P01_D01_bin.156]
MQQHQADELSFTQVYFIRHGIAAERGTYKDDEQRPLVNKGIDKTRRIAKRLTTFGIRFDTLLTSPLVRAVQTAEILCEAGLVSTYQVFNPLAPGGSIDDWLGWFSNLQIEYRIIALVGHEPDLSHWAQQLVHGKSGEQWTLKKAGIIGINIPRIDQPLRNSHLFWLAPPRFIL